MAALQKITPFLWFDREAEEAARFYTSVFPGSRVLGVTRYGDAGPGPAGSVMTIEFELAGQRLVALNGGPMFRLTEAFSLAVACESQQEIDRYWRALTSDGGEESQCGWLKDRYGLSWQVVPAALLGMLGDEDAARRDRVVRALMPMRKLDAAALEAAYRGA